ncbi:MAG: deoxyribonuclease IV [Chloroflexota bacterium]|nr:deoxyribonuclease IV [Chloroflexota bacterium]
MNFGAHMSVAGGLHKAFERGAAVGCRTMQIFSKNERQWQAKPLAADDIQRFKAEQARTGIGPLIVHDSYLINLASPKDDLWEKSIAAFADELERCDQLGIPYLVTHPGAHTGSGCDAGLEREAEALNRLFADGVGGDTMVLLETTAGQGSCLGGRFEELTWLIEHVSHPERVGICVDTCHIFAAGYDIRTPEGCAAVFERLLSLVGSERIKAFHLNDSKGPLGGHLDRHAGIGEGEIGLDGFRFIVNDPRFAALPMILETPKTDDGSADIHNLTLLRSLRSGQSADTTAKVE